jgi:hypothetical protein
MNNQKHKRIQTEQTSTEVIDAEVVSGLEKIQDLPPSNQMQLVKYENPKPKPRSQLEQWLPCSCQQRAKANERAAKKIVIVNAFTGDTQEIGITMGTRPKDLLAQLTKFKLGEDTVFRTDKGETLQSRDDVFKKLEEGTVLFAAQPAYAGASPSENLLAEAIAYAKQHVRRGRDQKQPRSPNVSRSQKIYSLRDDADKNAEAAATSAVIPALIERTIEPLWKDLGFTKSGRRYSGYFKTDDVMVEGYIEQRINGECEPHVFLSLDVQRKLNKHPKWACFHSRDEKGWFYLNLIKMPKDPSAAILEVQNILNEAYAQE